MTKIRSYPAPIFKENKLKHLCRALAVLAVILLASCGPSSKNFSLNDVTSSSGKKVSVLPVNTSEVFFKEDTAKVFLKEFFIGPNTDAFGRPSLPHAPRERQKEIEKLNPSVKIYKTVSNHIISALSLQPTKGNADFKIEYGYSWHIKHHPAVPTLYKINYRGGLSIAPAKPHTLSTPYGEYYNCHASTGFHFSYEDVYNSKNPKLRDELATLADKCISEIIQDFEKEYKKDVQKKQKSFDKERTKIP